MKATVRTGAGAYDTRVLIGADGVNGVTARALNLRPIEETAVAFEANYPLDEALARHWHQVFGLNLTGIPGGYGWIFPKTDHLNIGVGGWRHVGPTLRGRLVALCRFYGLDERRLVNQRGYQLPLYRDGAPVVRGHAMLIGDAAALIDPFSGEGIWGAFVSGRIAGLEALRYLAGDVSDLRGYQVALEREVHDDIRGSRRLQGVLERLPALSPMLLKYSDTLWRYVTEIMRGDLNYPDLPRKLGPVVHAVNLWGDLETQVRRRTVHRPTLYH